MTVDNDYWGWVEPDLGDVVIRPILGYLRGRRRFPPQQQHPGVTFQRFDPDVPEFLESAGIFLDYNVWSGWNLDKSMVVVGLTYDSTFGGIDTDPQSHEPWFAKMDTTSDVIADWEPDLSDKYDIPSTLEVRTQLRFIPRTNNCSFLATDLTHPQPRIFRLNTTTMTVDVVDVSATGLTSTKPIYSYCWSYDGNQLAINAPFGDEPVVRVFSRDGDGDVIAQLSPDDVFGFNVSSFGFTDNSHYMFAWDGSHHVVHDAFGAYGQQWSYPMNVVGQGLFGEQTYGITFVTPDPTHRYWYRSGAISLGLGGSNTMSQILDWDGNQVGPRLTGGYGGMTGEWDQVGQVLVATDGGRDPYGGVYFILQPVTFLSDGTSQQEIQDIRICPFHGIY